MFVPNLGGIQTPYNVFLEIAIPGAPPGSSKEIYKVLDRSPIGIPLTASAARKLKEIEAAEVSSKVSSIGKHQVSNIYYQAVSVTYIRYSVAGIQEGPRCHAAQS